jgi:hypothetical protein
MKTSSVSNSANQRISNFLADKANLVNNSANLFLERKFFQQFCPLSKFFYRHQQHDYCASISILTLARQRTELISLPFGAFFLYLRLTTYCRTFLGSPAPDSRVLSIGTYLREVCALVQGIPREVYTLSILSSRPKRRLVHSSTSC